MKYFNEIALWTSLLKLTIDKWHLQTVLPHQEDMHYWIIWNSILPSIQFTMVKDADQLAFLGLLITCREYELKTIYCKLAFTGQYLNFKSQYQERYFLMPTTLSQTHKWQCRHTKRNTLQHNNCTASITSASMSRDRRVEHNKKNLP